MSLRDVVKRFADFILLLAYVRLSVTEASCVDVFDSVCAMERSIVVGATRFFLCYGFYK